jgi:Domain of unknown function (DUF4331)
MILSRTSKVAVAPLAIVLALSVLWVAVPWVRAADHGDAPLASSYAAGDTNDVYAFLDPNDNSQIVIILTLRGFIAAGENANFGNFDPRILSAIELELTGDAQADLFAFVGFGPQILRTTPQTATISVATGPDQAPILSFTAPTTISSVAAAAPPRTITTHEPTGIQFFAGMTDDPFFFDIPGFGRFVNSVLAGTPDPSQLTRGRDSFAGYNTMAIAFRFSRNLMPVGLTTLGVGARTFRVSGTIGQPDFEIIEQLDRIATPAVNVALVPFPSKEAHNVATPLDDAAGTFAGGIVATLTALGTNQANINFLASLAVSNGDLLRLNLSTANIGNGGGTNAAAAFPNGRRLGDDTVDTLLTVITNGAITTGDNVNGNELPLLNEFPFLALPHQPRNPGVLDDQTRN